MSDQDDVMAANESERDPMQSTLRTRQTMHALAATAALLSALTVEPVHAATARWSGLGVSANWSDVLNWSPAATPADGDALQFFGSPPRATSMLDLSRSFSSLSFGADAGAFFLHVSGDGSSELGLSGIGLANLTAGTGPIRQSLFADAGSSGGTLRFAGGAGVNLALGFSARPVDLIALGAAGGSLTGGRIVFQDQSSVGTDTFDAVRALGAGVAGAAAAEINLRGNALAGRQSALVAAGGSSSAALGGVVSLLDTASAAGTVVALAGTGGGFGGRVLIAGNATLAVSSGLQLDGAAAGGAGAEGAASLRGDARMLGSAQLGAGSAAGAAGGRLEFFDRANHDTSNLDPTLGTVVISNNGSSIAGAGSAALSFHDDSFISGSRLVISNTTGEGAGLGTSGGVTSFLDRARAGGVSILNAGTSVGGAVGGYTRFLNQSSAESASIVMQGGSGDGSAGGSLYFGDDSRAAAASLRNEGGNASGAYGGSTRFALRASAGSARIVNAAAIAGASGGVTSFTANSGAGNATISNETALFGVGGRGSTLFMDASSAQSATIDNQGGLGFINAFTVFSQSASAGRALITNLGGRAAGAAGGLTQFIDSASAGTATLILAGGGVNGAGGGLVRFDGSSTAAGATLDLRGASVVGAEGGAARFFQGTSAGGAIVNVQGAQVAATGGPEGATVSFNFDASAGSATFTIEGNRFNLGAPGRVQFNDSSSAANASFNTQAGFDVGGRLSFTGSGLNLASAGNAQITNQSRQTGLLGNSDFGGATLFQASSTADRATITNQAGLTAFGAQTAFRADSTAADARIVNAGGRLGGRGGWTFFVDSASAGRAVIANQAGFGGSDYGLTQFDNNATAAQATITAAGATQAGGSGGRVNFSGLSSTGISTLIAEGGSNGGAGGRIEFQSQTLGGNARIVLNAGSGADNAGVLDVSGVAFWLPVGSIEGSGLVTLGARSLITSGSGAVTTFSGVINGSVPPVFPSLSVLGLGSRLTLTGANLYAGRTQIGDGLNADSGKLVVANTSGSATGSGAVQIERGGTLGGSGFIAGPVTLRAGGTIAPGDPVTLTLRDSLTWDGGGVIRLVLGSDDASSDHLVVQRLVKGSPGPFVFQFVNDGYTPGATYSVLNFGSIEGFSADDFSFSGAVGSFSLADGGLGFTLAVPEPNAAWMFTVGLLALTGFWRTRKV
jgi:fibronectin-binding autotransporter adhesin